VENSSREVVHERSDGGIIPAMELPRERSLRVLSLGLTLVLLISGCGTYLPMNRRLEPYDPDSGYRARAIDQADDSNQLILMVAMSGGGTRAAAFAYGVLEELAATQVSFDGRDRNLFDEIDGVTGVSGGSFVAAYLGLHGRAMFGSFEQRFLRKNVQTELILRLLWPLNWLRLFSPYSARSDLAADYYDSQIFDHATFADLARSGGPFVSIHATDLITGSPFSFTQDQFDYICSDLSKLPISRAVTASSAVPLLLSPITLRNYSDCGFEAPDWVLRNRDFTEELDREYVNAQNLLSYLEGDRRYIHLVDGVLSDNLGVRGPFEAWVKQQVQPAKRPPRNPVRDVVFIVVNAQTTPDTEWNRTAVLPSLGFILDAATSAQVNRYNFETIELLQRTFSMWSETTLRWDPPMRFGVIELSFLDVPGSEERAYLNKLSTSLALSDEAVDRLRAAARASLRGSSRFQELVTRLRGPGVDAPDPLPLPAAD
jgi:NTE family protein